MKIRNAMKRISALGVVFVAIGVSVFLVINTCKAAEGYGEMSYRPNCKFTHNGSGITAPSSYTTSNSTNATSSVMSKVKSDPPRENPEDPSNTAPEYNDNHGDISDYADLIYAQPGQYVTFTHCYFPGVQRVANTVVTKYEQQHSLDDDINAHSVYSSSNGLVYNIENKKMAEWTEDETEDGRHLKHYKDDFWEFVDAPNVEWTTIPNYSRVIGLAVPDGGLNIYNNVPASATGQDTDNFVDNVYGVGGQYLPTVGKYTETHYLPQPNHVSISTAETHRWTCRETVNRSRCIVGSNGHGGYIYGSRNGYTYDSGTCYIAHTCSHNVNYIGYSIDYDESAPNRSEASVIVPYNYALNATIDIEGDRVFAGETAKLINTKVGAEAKWNNLTQGTYITDVPYARARVVTYYSNDPNGSGGSNYQRGEFIEHKTGSTSLDLNTNEWPWTFPENTVNVYDDYAGKYFCAFLEFYPKTSGDDKFDESGYLVGDNQTGTSNRVCKPIAKKPSLQIWGGSLYSAGNISLLRATKNNLMDVTGREYSVDRADNVNVFSSWGELSVTSIGGIKGFASGGATSDSYRDKDNSQVSYGKLEPNEQRVSGFCKYESPLTYANYSTAFGICGSGAVDTAGMFASKATKVDKYSYIEEIVGDKLNLKDDSSVVPNLTSNDTITIGVSESAKGKVAFHTVTSKTNKKLLITKSNNIITINRSLSTRAVPKGQTYLIYTTKQVKINDDIIYEGGYSKIEDMPKVVIYANTIAISCNVSRVDAVLIAVDWVSTCYEDTNRQDKQLMINGTVIADRMYAPREFGAGPGKYSGIPAEIINYDSSLVLWGQRKADATESGIFNTAYVRELAPRY